MRICKKCSIEKDLNLFTKNGKYFLRTCKECVNARYRTGRENTGRFKKGIQPTTMFKKGHIPWITGLTHSAETREKLSKINKGKKYSQERIEKVRKALIRSNARKSFKNKEWAKNVKERDDWKCQHCGLERKEDLQAHHIIPWKDNIELRFDLSNGLTLCRSCHKKEDLKIHPMISWNKGKKLTEDQRAKLRVPKKNKKGRLAII